MRVLVINVGSTSVKYHLYEMDREETLAEGVVERVKSAGLRAALDEVLAHVGDAGELRAVGHRVVHGGEKLLRPVVVTEDVKRTIRACSVFAPLHNPANLEGIEAAQAALPNALHVAVFDTAFHGELPPHAFVYAIPYELYLDKGVRRYGFHGPSHQYMAMCASEHLKT